MLAWSVQHTLPVLRCYALEHSAHMWVQRLTLIQHLKDVRAWQSSGQYSIE